jgi:hypothetical protein
MFRLVYKPRKRRSQAAFRNLISGTQLAAAAFSALPDSPGRSNPNTSPLKIQTLIPITP